MLLYSLLCLTGYDLPLDDLKRLRQWGSKTPGQPEYGRTPGVELPQDHSASASATTSTWRSPKHSWRQHLTGPIIIDYQTYAIVSDGDLMEGGASEAASLAGHLKLHILIYILRRQPDFAGWADQLGFRRGRA